MHCLSIFWIYFLIMKFKGVPCGWIVKLTPRTRRWRSQTPFILFLASNVYITSNGTCYTMHGIDLGANCDRAGTSLSFFPNPPLEFSSRVSIDLDSCVSAKNLLKSAVKIGLFRTCLPMLFLCNCMIWGNENIYFISWHSWWVTSEF